MNTSPPRIMSSPPLPLALAVPELLLPTLEEDLDALRVDVRDDSSAEFRMGNELTQGEARALVARQPLRAALLRGELDDVLQQGPVQGSGPDDAAPSHVDADPVVRGEAQQPLEEHD